MCDRGTKGAEWCCRVLERSVCAKHADGSIEAMLDQIFFLIIDDYMIHNRTVLCPMLYSRI